VPHIVEPSVQEHDLGIVVTPPDRAELLSRHELDRKAPRPMSPGPFDSHLRGVLGDERELVVQFGVLELGRELDHQPLW
jgi:hypothetical protein